MSKNNPTLTKTLSLLPGCADHSHREWLIGPVGVHRDSDAIERANFRAVVAALAKIDPKGEDHEVHRFGHWGVGWVEEIATRPGSPSAIEAESIADVLSEYPVVSDDAFSEEESSDEDEAWDSYVRKDFVEALDSVLDRLDSEASHSSDDFFDVQSVFEVWREGCDAFNLYVEHSSEGPSFPIERWAREALRTDSSHVSEWGRAARAKLRTRLVAIAEATRLPE